MKILGDNGRTGTKHAIKWLNRGGNNQVSCTIQFESSGGLVVSIIAFSASL